MLHRKHGQPFARPFGTPFGKPLKQTPASAATYASTLIALAPANLLAYWKLDETSGTNAADSSGNGRVGTYSGVTLNQLAGPGASMGNAGLGDGVNDSCNIYSASFAGAFDPNAFTVSMWVNVTTHTSGRVFFQLGADASNFIMLRLLAGTSLQARYLGGATEDNASWNTGGATGVWHHVALTINDVADELKFFGDGVQRGVTGTTLGTWSGALAATLCAIWAGSNSGANPFHGYCQHCAVWNSVLTPAQIATLAVAA